MIGTSATFPFLSKNTQLVAGLPEGELLISVEYSSLNYKDALSAIGHPGVSRKFPHTPGIDAAGRVTGRTLVNLG